jgi:hypothetical protein
MNNLTDIPSVYSYIRLKKVGPETFYPHLRFSWRSSAPAGKYLNRLKLGHQGILPHLLESAVYKSHSRLTPHKPSRLKAFVNEPKTYKQTAFTSNGIITKLLRAALNEDYVKPVGVSVITSRAVTVCSQNKPINCVIVYATYTHISN